MHEYDASKVCFLESHSRWCSFWALRLLNTTTSGSSVTSLPFAFVPLSPNQHHLFTNNTTLAWSLVTTTGG